MNKESTFHFSNYSKPTPKNLLMVSEAIQGTLLGVSTMSAFASAPTYVVVSLNISILIVNQLVKFFGNVVHEEIESATAQFPSGEEVTITHSVDNVENK